MKHVDYAIIVISLLLKKELSAAQSCGNDPDFIFKDNRRRSQGCDWIKNENRRRRFCNVIGTSGDSTLKKTKESCPKACLRCPAPGACVDSAMPVELLAPGEVYTKSRYCSWFKDPINSNFCENETFKRSCPEACNVCGRPLKSQVCKIVVLSSLRFDYDADNDELECILDPIDADGEENVYVPIQATDIQKRILKKMFDNNEIISGVSTLELEDDILINDYGILIPSSKETFNFGATSRKSRHLVQVEGDKPILVIKVIDSEGRKRQESTAQISDDVFGTFGDKVTLRSQMNGCSFGKVNIQAGVGNPKESSPGVLEITIDKSLNAEGRSTIRRAVVKETQAVLGHRLPGPYSHVMVVLQGCYKQCGWAAYAYANSWLSVYQGNNYKYVGVQMHEIGHNLNFAHSGGLDGRTYTDHTGMMGNPLYSDDVGAMCFNAAKNWQIGWYDSNAISIDPRVQQSWYGTMVGIADYENNPENHPVVVKIETRTATDQFIAFNRATGVNRQNDEADDQVTIVTAGSNGEWYSQSYLLNTLKAGQEHKISNWGNGQTLHIKAISININPGNAAPGYAEIAVCLGECKFISEMPSINPTYFPSGGPSRRPTTEPSSNPISTPSHYPSVEPSQKASATPSGSPTTTPSELISEMPSFNPTYFPSGSPSLRPTTEPSSNPTSAPSHHPSLEPSQKVSATPSGSPTATHSLYPSVEMSRNPTYLLTTGSPIQSQPASSPLRINSQKPSHSPLNPTGTPTASPSLKYTKSPKASNSPGNTKSPKAGNGGTISGPVHFVTLGLDFDGISTDDELGHAVAISKNGLRVAIAAPGGNGGRGLIRIYDWQVSTTTWTQVGTDISTTNMINHLGFSMDMNEDGSRIVVGAPESKLDDGIIQVYYIQGDRWSLLGIPIAPPAGSKGHAGYSVTMNNDGDIIAYGAPRNNGYRGSVKAFKYEDSTWQAMGQSLDASGYYSSAGGSIAMSGNGRRLAVGSTYGDWFKGSVHILDFDEESSKWVFIGSLAGDLYYDRFGSDVDISENGNRVIVGAKSNDGNGKSSGQSKVFEYDGFLWNQLGQTVVGANERDILGESVAISGDGRCIAISSPKNDENGILNAGKVSMYRYSETDQNWIPYGSDIYGEGTDSRLGEGNGSIALDRYGRHLIVGSIRGNYYAGKSRVFEAVPDQ